MSKQLTGFVAWIRSFLDDVYANITHTHSKSDITDLAENVYYGTCSTVSTAQIKEVTVSNWSFTTGNVLFVKFDDYNKYNGTAQIKIGSTSKDIATVGTTKTSRYYWKAGEIVGFVYDGTNMVMMEQGTATTTYFGITKLSSSTTSTSETLSATPKAVKTAYDLANEKLGSSDVGAVALSNDYVDLDNKPTIPSKTSDLNNDSGFITSSSLPTKTSDLTNDGDGTNAFLTQHQSLTNYIQKSNTSGLLKNDGSIDTTQYLSSLPSHNHDDRYYTESEMDTALNGKQATLVSGTNIKTINNNSLLGSGNITVGGGTSVEIATSWGNPTSDSKVPSEKLAKNTFDSKIDMEQLVSSSFNIHLYETTSYMTDKNSFTLPQNTNMIFVFNDMLTNIGDYVSFKITKTDGNGYLYDTSYQQAPYPINSNVTVKIEKSSSTTYTITFDTTTTYQSTSPQIKFGNAGTTNFSGYFGSKEYVREGTWLDIVYPIGALYLSTMSRNPSTVFGGTWQQIEDKFLLASGTTYSNGSTGGEATHTLTVDEMPSHNHTAGGGNVLGMGTTSSDTTSGFTSGNLWNGTKKRNTAIDNRGGGQAHNNMPPYLAVMVYERIA